MDWIANQLSLFFEYKQVANKNKLGDKASEKQDIRKTALWLDSSNWKHFLFFESQRWQQPWD